MSVTALSNRKYDTVITSYIVARNIMRYIVQQKVANEQEQ